MEVLVFTHFCQFCSFERISENRKEKKLIHKITVAVAFEVDTQNTKNQS